MKLNLFVLLVKKIFVQKKKINRFKKQKELYTNDEVRQKEVKIRSYIKKEMLNIGELLTYQILINFFEKRDFKLIVCPQVLLRTFIEEVNDDDNKLHAGLYVDFVIVNDNRLPVLVIEVDGKGHNTKNDEVKNTILSNAGVDLIRIDTSDWERGKIKYKEFILNKLEPKLQNFVDNYNRT
ncbi:MAG: DUF2726 domain-containing protein [Neisseriaceae bacterium]|nr:MAG: DUF2726 domain-containing protein [Neisseriaceae bacterium]